MTKQLFAAGVCLAMLLGTGVAVLGDEGMWLFNAPPKELLKKRYGFVPSDAWLEHVQKASVRFNSGGSGSFVSPDGLVMTNHHVAADAIQKLSTKENDYLRDGFFAKTREQELKCVDLELNVLMSIEDVTERVNAAVKPGLPPEEAAKARRAIIATIEKESKDKTGLRSNVIPLFAGGQYHLYRFKQYTDVRLVFAPEQQIAFFGGDADNFAYPRYDLDVTFLRVYENGKPAKIEHYLKWSANGAQEGELVFVSGHPGRTNRQNTVAELEYLRDTGYPFLLQRLNRLEVMLSVYSGQSQENARRAKDELFGVANSRKARIGGLQGLLDPQLFGRKVAEERRLREAIAKEPKFKEAADAFDRIAAAEKKRAEIIKDLTLLENGAGFNSIYFSFARTLLRAADELPKDNAERLPEFRDSGLDSLKLALFTEEAIYNDLEQVKLTDSLIFLAITRGVNDKLVQAVLQGKSPQARAFELINGTKLKDVAVRKALFEGGKKAVDEAKDPFIELARVVDAESRRLRKIFESEVDEVKKQAYAQLAKVRYALDAGTTYPDATFTLRLAFGPVKGYEEDGKQIPAFTDIGGLYQRGQENDFKPPFDIPERWLKRKDKLNLKTPFNFVAAIDIIGGNSGSPVINKNAEVVGLIFDGNIQSLVWDFIYDDTQARSVSVDSRGIIEALRNVYDAHDLIAELTGGRAK
jgi:hypothetical protein